ncbi:MAG: GNAT family N-acetyltransferase [Colwellia sp.]|nr:GNAT family N-acetyltransferase [Colwellia sp.]
MPISGIKDVVKSKEFMGFGQMHIHLRNVEKQKGLPTYPYKFITMLWAEFSLLKKATLFLAEHKGKTIAGVLLFKYKERISAEYSVLDNKFLSLSPCHFLFWEVIKSAYEEGYKIFLLLLQS